MRRRLLLLNPPSLTMSAVSSTFGTHYPVHSEECAISLSLKTCCFNQGSLVISFRSGNSVRPIHLFGHYFDHDYYFELPFAGERDAQSLRR